MHAVKEGLNKYSSRITQPKSQGASQAMLYATGLKEEDMNKPQVRFWFTLSFHPPIVPSPSESFLLSILNPTSYHE